MQRSCLYRRLYPGAEEEFDRRQVAIDPEVSQALRDAGMHNLSVFRRGTDVWQYAECAPDAEAALARFHAAPAGRAWSESVSDIVWESSAVDGQPLWYREVFHANGGANGPMQRGLFALVVDPARVDEYDARHADPWPEMMRALDEAGFHNYSGFRRGSNVVYYGEFYPDMQSAVEHIGSTDVNRRWSESFAGIITMLVGPDGKLITAREVYHQD
jgi:L-rhamnose mutarotase